MLFAAYFFEVRMKKVLAFLRSMKFGIILLGLIAALSVVGSIIPQNSDAMTYVRAYPNFYQIIFTLKLNDVFNSWYFNLVTVLLCINLIMCSIVRFTSIPSQEQEEQRALNAKTAVPLTEKQREDVIAELERMRCRKKEENGVRVYSKNRIGSYGTFLTHLGILLTVVFWAAAMKLPTVIDRTCYPLESITLEDGTDIYVKDFSITDDEGKLDYKSHIEVTLPDGRTSEVLETSVNHPAAFGSYKIYQQTYGTAPRVAVSDAEGHQDLFYLESNDILTADGRNGIIFDNLYPGFTEEDGHMRLETSTSGRYENPVYVFTTLEDGKQQEVMLAFPGDCIESGDYVFCFQDPVEYPGLRIKHSPGWVNIALLCAFMVMTLGLYITFFLQSVLVRVDTAGYTLLSAKSEGLQIRFRQITGGGNEHA